MRGDVSIFSTSEINVLSSVMAASRSARCKEKVERLSQQRADLDAAITELNTFISLVENIDNSSRKG